MTEKRVQFNKIVTNQLPLYVQEDFPLIGDFLKSYYLGQEFQGAPLDLLQNIDRYVQLNNCSETIPSTTLSSDIDSIDATIDVSNTDGFPENYGLIKIDNEIITYESKTKVSFVNCIRGFSGITSFRNPDNPEDLVFSTSIADSHSSGNKVENLSVLFLEKFLNKIKYQILPGFKDRQLLPDLNESEFIKHSKDFYTTRGTDVSFKILFKSLYGEDVTIIKPKDYVISPSNANYRKTKDIIVESVSGDPFDLINKTLYQDEFENIAKAYSSVSNVENVSVGILTDKYYKVSLDGSFINKQGSNIELLYDNFSVHAKTKVIGNVGIGQTFIDVDSTLGFPSSGSITFAYNDSSIGVVTYSDKTYNQFINVSGVEKNILDKTSIDQNTFAYASGAGTTDGIRIRIRSVLNELVIPNNCGQKTGSRIKIISLGKIGNNAKQNNWIFNTSQSYYVNNISLIDTENNVYRVETKDKNILRIGDKIKITSLSGETLNENFDVTNIFNQNTLVIRGTENLNLNNVHSIRRVLSKVSSDFYPYLNKYSSNVQNTYIDGEKVLVSSSSLPSVSNLKLNPKLNKIFFSGKYFIGESVFKITTNIDHNFFTGDAVYYTPEKDSQGNVISYLFEEGLYFVKRIDENNVKFAKSRSNIFKELFVSITTETKTITNNCIEKYDFASKIIETPKILREISPPINDGKLYKTKSGFTGILVNGVEILNYKSQDKVYYGQINSIDVISGGKDYDVINPPSLNISDPIGFGATGFFGVTGSFQEILIKDPGFDYIEVPKIKISGGNGTGALAEAKLKVIPYEVIFDASSPSEVGIGSDVSTIGFTTYHKFRNAERVVYKTFGSPSVVGLNTNSVYYISVIDDHTIKLHGSFDGAVVGIETVSLVDYGSGRHAISSLNGKAVLNNINIINSGSGYQNKTLTCGPTGINTSLNIITISNHGYKTGEIIKYISDGQAISGINTTDEYYVTTVDKDSFRLSIVGVGTTNNDFYFKTKQFLELKTSGIGTHIFNYPDIKVEIIGKTGISSIGENTFEAQIYPIVRGEITSVHLSKNGVGYGSSDIINFERYPDINTNLGSSAQLHPIVHEGKIVDVTISNRGSNYNSIPKLTVIGEGNSANLIPILSDGMIISVKIDDAGIGYGASTTSIKVEPFGVGANFKINLQSWQINQFVKNYTNITEDDVFVANSFNSDYGLQCSHVYAPRSLRSSLYSTDQFGNLIYGKFDIMKVNNVESNSINHSPIIGWAYDGNPIYGPYGYSNSSGGSIVQLKSGYSLDLKPNRPPLGSFPKEFFVEDFTWFNSTDESYLDENNGRFCVTPDYPNGVYAYFATFEQTASSDEIFKNYKKPLFPYLIGENYKSKPIDFNFKRNSNQDGIDLNQTNWIRNTYPYQLNQKNSTYEYISESYKYTSQDSIIKYTKKGKIDSVGIITGGKNYKVNDRIIFEADPVTGFSANAKVYKVLGVGINTISVESIILSEVEFYPWNFFGNSKGFIGITKTKNNLKNGDAIVLSGLTTSSSLSEGSYRIGITTSELKLTKQLDSSTVTGIVTYIDVSCFSSDFEFPNLKINDTLTLYGEFGYYPTNRQLSPQVGIAITSKALPQNATRTKDSEIYNWCWDHYDAFDVDGDGIVSENDATILLRYYFGSFSGDNLIYKIDFPNNATRNTSKSIRSFIGLHTMGGTAYHDVDGNGSIDPLGDMLMVARVFGSNDFKNPDDDGPAQRNNAFFGEEVKVLNIDKKSSRIRVLRSVNNTQSYRFAPGSVIKNNPRIFKLNVGVKTNFDGQINTEYYFDPKESIGIGSDISVGVGVTLQISNPGSGKTQIFVPTRAVYLPNHNLVTGDEVIYYTNSGDSIAISTVGGGTSSIISNYSSLFVAKLSNDFIGLSTVKVGLGTTGTFVGASASTSHQGLLYFVGLGTGTYHSFKTLYPNVITGTVQKSIVKVSTASSHNLNDFDTVDIEVNPSISTSFIVKYNSSSKKLVLNELSFTSESVDILNNSIYIENHKLTSGQKVIHVSDYPSGGLKNEFEYYAYVVDRNTIKFANSKYESTQKNPSFINITSPSSGTLLPVNPPIKVYKNGIVDFDLSDESLSYTRSGLKYPAFKLNFYKDQNFVEQYQTSGKNVEFDVIHNGVVGVSSDARVSLKINENTPKLLYYKLIPLDTAENSDINKQISIDDSIDFNNQIIVEDSVYNGKFSILTPSQNTFTYTLNSYPESELYSSSQSFINYSTTSLSAQGSIKSVILNDKGEGYTKIPSVVSIASSNGTEARLEVISNSIGKIKKTSIENIGFDYPSDTTLKPSVKVPQILQIELLTGLDFVGISSFGKFYLVPPKLVVIDSVTDEVISDIDIRIVDTNWQRVSDSIDNPLDQSSVKIISNTFSLSNQIPKIIPIQNSNGIGISSLSYNSNNGEVTATLKNSYSINEEFPIVSGDKVLVEGASVGVGSTGIGYNSENYNYQLFKVTGVHQNLGGVGVVTYKLSDYLTPGQYPGNFDPGNSSVVLVPERFFPTFKIILKSQDFKKLDIVTDGNASGKVFEYDVVNKYLIVEGIEDFQVNKIISSKETGARGRIKKVLSFDSNYNLDYYSIVNNGWEYTTGVLNDSSQRLHDNEYYQNFSYAIKSKVYFDKWNDAVSSLTHTAGFRKFSDLQIESISPTSLSPDVIPSLTATISINSEYDLNCVSDFDLAYENYLTDEKTAFSDEINFYSLILTDYGENISNRVLRIDDISSEFNSSGRTTPYGVVKSINFNTSKNRFHKYFTYVRDRLFTGERQISILNILNDPIRGVGMINQYGTLDSQNSLGYFDYDVDTGSNTGFVKFYPVKYRFNNYNISYISYNIDEVLTDSETQSSFRNIGVSTNLSGPIVSIAASNVFVNAGIAETILRLPKVGIITSGVRSAKILTVVESNESRSVSEYNEINIVHDGTELHSIEFGQLSLHTLTDGFSSSGIGTFYPYLSGSDIVVDYTLKASSGITTAKVSSIVIGISSEKYTFDNTGVGATVYMPYGLVAAREKLLVTSATGEQTVVSIPNEYDAAYFVVQVSDVTNVKYQISEIVVLWDSSDAYITEFGVVSTSGQSLGDFGARLSGSNLELTFTKTGSYEARIKSLVNFLKLEENTSGSTPIELISSRIENSISFYTGTEIDVKKDFNLTYKGYPIFKRVFDGSDPSVVDLQNNTVFIPNHFFVGGEEVSYYPKTGIGTNNVGIATTTIAGIGTTDKLPSSVFIIKVNESKIKFAASAQNALKEIPVSLDLTSVGIGTSHSIVSKNQNQKVLISIDNLVQSPIVLTSIASSLSNSALRTQDLIYLTGITSFFSGNYIKVDNEIMKIVGVGIGSTNAIQVSRAEMGTVLAGHDTGSRVVQISGNYNIVENIINFADPPPGRTPIGSITDPVPFRDWEGITTSASFSGRMFMHSGAVNGTEEAYAKNYVFDDISQNFTASRNTYTLQSGGSNVVGVATNNAFILINGIVQGKGLNYDYTLSETSGITSITFTGSTSTQSSDPNSLNIPTGGVIVSVGSTMGFGYQPLVSAGGTAIVSIAGTISSVSIGNSGSGYRVGVQTVRVAVSSSTTGIPNLQFIGTAVVSNGHIVSIAVTNSVSGFSQSNPPYVIIDDPLPYSNIPLIYSQESLGSGGVQAKVDITVGQGSSVVAFTLRDSGYGYGVNHILTVPIGGLTGIPTTSVANFREFQLSIQEVETDRFSAWSVGELEVLDNFSNLFNGSRKAFPITRSGSPVSIQSKYGSLVKVEDVVIIFINDILQVPGLSYKFRGGSTITFREAPKPDDRMKFFFYKGTSGIDILPKEVTDPVQIGDGITLNFERSLGQKSLFQQNERIITKINSSSSVDTNAYYGPGLSEDSELLRSATICRQTEDLIVENKLITKDREIYEPSVYPVSYIIQPLGIGSTSVYVDSIRPFFFPQNESSNLEHQNKITINSQKTQVGAAATAVVSIAGTISNIVISDGGVGYTTCQVTIENPIGIGTTRATAIPVISVGGTISTIQIENAGIGYTNTNPPVVLISPPTTSRETIGVTTYYGDSGIIVGIAFTVGFNLTVGVGSTVPIDKMVLDLFIPTDSHLRSSTVTGTAVTVSGITTGDFFVINKSNIGVYQKQRYCYGIDNSVVGISTSFLDGIYQVRESSVIQSSVTGIGVTYINRVVVNVTGAGTKNFTSIDSTFDSLLTTFDYSISDLTNNDIQIYNILPYYGNFTWGKLVFSPRVGVNTFVSYAKYGLSGINTSDYLQRTNRLKFKNYTG